MMVATRSIKNFLSAYWKTILVIPMILYLSFASSSTFKSIPQFAHSDKITHVLMYLALTIVIINDFYKRYKQASFFLVFVCLIFPVILGGIIEVIQELFTASRSGSWSDWLADILGVLLGGLMSLIYIKIKSK